MKDEMEKEGVVVLDVFVFIIICLLNMSRLQKVETRKLQLAGTGERLIISNSYNCHRARSPVPARKNLLFAGDSYISVSSITKKTNAKQQPVFHLF
jgi:hypothetical protein